MVNGRWPVIFGVDSKSKAAAVAFAIDHNNLGLMGGNLGFTDMLAMWDETGLQQVLADVPDASELLTSLDSDDVHALLDSPDFKPVDESQQSRLDEKKHVTCPECGHEFCALDFCDHRAAKHAVMRWHYSRKMPASKLVRIGVWEEGRFCGAVLYGVGANRHLARPFGLEDNARV